ncbi:uncharacterized protein LOC62_05G007006 [Vanrija pseudolonga]|uniref:TMEM205-like domain-containing protein n=1 Tax=Vanrija pseudolonga TaxID=143232 RepID=A0AAF0YB91_9TREE|nr:hypothetical protein LOC62_05G007006 [Vanrija pseudolonga]
MSGVIHKALAPFTLKGFYLLTWGTALGTNVWQTISAFKAFGTLERKTFGQLQAQLQPLYFATSSALTGALLAAHLYFHPNLVGSILKTPHWWQIEEGVQGLFIVASLVPQLANLLVVGPKAVKVSLERHQLEQTDGKAYNDANPSEAMVKLNKSFSTLHGIASSLNLVSFLGLTGLGLAVSL